MSRRHFVIAGNGPSLALTDPGSVIAEDFIIRTNSFFLEREFHLGSRVDLALIAGDPRVAPFVFATLKKVSEHYNIENWIAVKAKVAQIGHRFMKTEPMQIEKPDQDVAKRLEQLEAQYQATPTAGIRALIMAHAMGARDIVLTGIDLYSGPERYVFEPGRHMRDLLGPDIAQRPYDMRLHHPDLDLAMLEYMASRSDLSIKHASKNGPLSEHLDLALPRMGTPITASPKPSTDDWVTWAGWYPIAALKIMRKLRAVQRNAISAREK